MAYRRKGSRGCLISNFYMVQVHDTPPKYKRTEMKKLYGIRVPMAVDDYIWVCGRPDPKTFEVSPILFDSKEKALESAKIWGPLAYVKEYDLTLQNS